MHVECSLDVVQHVREGWYTSGVNVKHIAEGPASPQIWMQSAYRRNCNRMPWTRAITNVSLQGFVAGFQHSCETAGYIYMSLDGTEYHGATQASHSKTLTECTLG